MVEVVAERWGLAERSRVAAGGLLVLACLLAAAANLRVARLAWQEVPQTRLDARAAAAALRGNVSYQQSEARFALSAGHPNAAHALLKHALDAAPLTAGLWLDRADAALHAGLLPEAHEAAIAATVLAPTDAAGCYRAAIVLLQAGDGDAALLALRCVVDSAPSRTAQALDLADAVTGGDTVRLRAVVPPDADGLRQLLAWAYARRRPEMAAVAWDGLGSRGATAGDRLRHIDFLLGEGRIDAAEDLWTAGYGARSSSRVFDGGFEDDPVDDGFGWILARDGDTRVTFVGGGAAAHGHRALAIELGRGGSEQSPVRQIVPVDGGRRYRLSALVRADGLAARLGPRIEVRAYPPACPSFAVGRELSGGSSWGAVGLEFDTARACRAVEVVVRRPVADRPNDDRGGRFYLDDVQLIDIGDVG
jgi:tetratricopeptide (TPR) repeat protein